MSEAGEDKANEASRGGAWGARRRVGLVLGPALLLVVLALPAPAGLAPEAWRTAGVALLMATWWVSEALPLPATALVPLMLLPLLGVAPIGEAARPFANPLIFLFLGGFLVALAIERWGLHRRIALAILARAGGRPVAVVGGFMLATAVLSMWVSNTATAMMMLPIGLSVLALLGDGPDEDGDAPHSNLSLALLLGIAYGASIGGLGTLVGTPPNALLAGYMLEAHGVEIGFARWMLFALPLAALLLPLAWLLLTRVLYPVGAGEIAGAAARIAGERAHLGPMSHGERMIAGVAAVTALAWITRPLLDSALPGLGLSDAGIAVMAAVMLFVLPVDLDRGVFLLDWKAAKALPWGILVLFGGGLSLAAAIGQTGLAGWIGAELRGLGGMPVLVVVLAVTAVVVFLTELTSNTATTAAFLPVAGALAVSLGEGPLALAAPAAVAASCAFMLPVATPPNAIVYGSGRVAAPEMARAGVWLNLIAIAAITLLAQTLLAAVFAAG